MNERAKKYVGLFRRAKTAAACPQQCAAGAAYAIDRTHCLHCGRCVEPCPAGAILPLHP